MFGFDFYRRYGKRAFDFGLAAVGLAAAAGPMAAVGAAIRVLDGEPVFFRQKRVGRDASEFELVKFRTMAPGSEAGGSVTTGTDARVTGVGRWLRRFKLDELPQLLNVLAGEMSFVGPRPDVPGYADRLEGEQRRILELRPGITGPATLAYRNEEKILAAVDDPQKYNDEVIYPDKVRINLEYIDQCSLMTDLKYIVETVAGSGGS